MREVELKAVCDDLSARRQQLEKAGAKLTYNGRLLDKRYDIESKELAGRDEVLRVRRYEGGGSTKTFLDWKGPTETKDVYKIREEISTATSAGCISARTRRCSRWRRSSTNLASR